MNYYLKIIAADKVSGAYKEYCDVWIGNGYNTHMCSEVRGERVYLDQEVIEPFLKIKGNDGKERICFSYQVIDSASFDGLIKDAFNNIRRKTINDFRWENLSHSIEYLKLSDEEKANVKNEFDFYEEADGDPYEKELQDFIGIKYLIQSVENNMIVDPNKVYGIVYNGEAFKEVEE